VSGAQVVEADGTMEIDEASGSRSTVQYREMVLRRALAGQVGSWGGTWIVFEEETHVLPDWWWRSEAGARPVFWALESRGDDGRQLWVWSTDGSASWHVDDGFFGQLPIAPGLPWLHVERRPVE